MQLIRCFATDTPHKEFSDDPLPGVSWELEQYHTSWGKARSNCKTKSSLGRQDHSHKEHIRALAFCCKRGISALSACPDYAEYLYRMSHNLPSQSDTGCSKVGQRSISLPTQNGHLHVNRRLRLRLSASGRTPTGQI